MIECPTCQIGFSPKFRVCPICGDYRAKLEDRIEYLEQIAEDALDQGATADNVEAMLAVEGLSAERARAIVSTRGMKVRTAIRLSGLKQLVVGLGLFLLSAYVLSGLFASPPRIGVRGTVAGVFGAATGVLLLAWGVYSFVAGRR